MFDNLENIPFLDSIRFTPNDVLDTLSSLNTNKSVDPDLIHPSLKEACRSIFPLCDLFDIYLCNCKYPSDWKLANDTAIFKNGDSSSVSNYR